MTPDEVLWEYIDNLISNPKSLIQLCYRKKSFGSTNPNLVRQSVRKEEKWLKKL